MVLRQAFDMYPASSDSEGGFALVEVLVSFAILSLTLIVLLQTVSQGARNARYVRTKTDALEVAQSKLASVGHDIALRNGITEGTTPRGLRWTLEVSPYAEPASLPPGGAKAFWIDVTVLPQHAGTQHAPLIRLRSVKLGRPDE